MDVTSNHLAYYLDRIRKFLISDGKSQVFPSLTMGMEDILVNIAKNMEFLKNGRFDDDCKSLATQITEVLERNKKIFTLSYGFVIDEHGKKVMVYKKTPVPIVEPIVLKQLRRPNLTQPASNTNDSSGQKNSVMSSFKTASLNATLKFVKNDSQLVLRYPDMTTEQMEYIKQMISQCMTPKETSDPGIGFKGLYDPLIEALRIFSLKYEFKLNDAVPVHNDMKRLSFEKIPKSNKIKEVIDLDTNILTESSDSSSDSSHLQVAFITQLIENLKKSFKHNALLQIRDLITRTKCSLIFPNVTEPEEIFLGLWKTIARNTEYQQLFDDEMQAVLREIRLVDKERRFKIQTTVQVLEKKRTVFFKKIWSKNIGAQDTLLPIHIDHKPGKITPIAKLNDINEENTTGLNKNHLNTVSVAKVNDSSEVIKNEPVSSISATKLNGNTEEFSNSKKFITMSDFKCLSTSTKKQKKLRFLSTIIAGLKPSFALNSLVELRDFLLDEAKISYTFTNLSIHELQFLMQWRIIIKHEELIRIFSYEGRIIIDEILNAMKSGSDKFQIKIMEKISSTRIRSVILTKQPKNSPGLQTIQNSDDHSSVCSSSSFSSTSTNRSYKNKNSKIDRQNKKLQKFLNKTKDIDEIWLRTTLTRLKNFVKEESQASLIVPNITTSQAEILTKWQKMLSSSDIIKHFSPGVQQILTEIHQLVLKNSKNFSITFNTTKITRRQARDITFQKNPRFPTVQSKAQAPVKDLKGKVLVENILKDNNIWENSADNIDTAKRNQSATNSYLKSASVSSLLAAKTSKPADSRRPKSANVTAMPKAKALLIEALSQPLVSEKGLRMMRNMGWDGGALGLRGEGIVEPIMLPLDLKKRAGLGSKKQPIIQPVLPLTTNLPVNITRVVLTTMPNRVEFNTGVLQTIMNMLVELQPATEVTFASKLSQKRWSFVRSTVNSFNTRTKVSFEPSMMELRQKILEILKTGIIITACWGVSKKNILFILSKEIYQYTDLDSKDWCSVVNIDNLKKQKEAVTVDRSDSDNIITAGKTFRYYVLAQILEFCQQPNITLDKSPRKGMLTKEVPLKESLALKQMNYIKDVIRRLNNRSRPCSDLVDEQRLFDEVKMAMHGFDLEVEFPLPKNANENRPPVYKVIRFQKIFDSQKTASKTPSNITDNIKFGIRPVSIEKIQIDNIIKERNKNVQQIKNNIEPAKAKTSMNNITEDPNNKIIQITNNEQNNTKDDSNAKRRITFTNDSFDSKCLFENRNESMDGQDAPNITVAEDCICCSPDYEEDGLNNEDVIIIEDSDEQTVEDIFIEKENNGIQNRAKDMPIVTECDKENYKPMVTENDEKENYMPMVTENDKKQSERPNVPANDEKEDNMSMVIKNDKKHYDRVMVTASDEKENDMSMVTENDKKQYEMPMVPSNGKKENDMPMVIGNYKKRDERVTVNANDEKENDRTVTNRNNKKHNKMPMVPANDEKENGKSTVTENNKKQNLRLMVPANDEKENDMLVVTENDKSHDDRVMVNANDEKENDRPMTTKNDTPMVTENDKKHNEMLIGSCMPQVTENDKKQNERPILPVNDKKENDKPIVTENCKNRDDRVIVTVNDRKENDRPMTTDNDKKHNEMPMVPANDEKEIHMLTVIEKKHKPMVSVDDQKENDMPMTTENDKKHNVRTTVPANFEKENDTSDEQSVEYIFIEKESNEIQNCKKDIDMPILTDYDKENGKPMVTKNDEKDNDKSIITENDKNQYERAMVTADDEKDNDMPMTTANDKKHNEMPMVLAHDEKENDIPKVTENERNADASTSMRAEKDDDLINLQNLNIIDYNSLARADNHMKCAENILKEFEEPTRFDLLLSRLKDRRGDQEIEHNNPDQSKISKELGKRLRSANATPERLAKKCKFEFVKKINITPKDYPHSEITNKMAGELQKSILTSIDYTDELPLLKCRGIKDGALSYSCHTKKSCNLIESVARSLGLHITVTQEIEAVRHKMEIRINTFIEESVDTIFKRLETYNKNLNTKDWKVIKKEQGSDIIVIYVDIDDNSYKFIVKENFTLYVGTDEAKFSIVWA